ncbi:MAG: NAD(P)-dependent oxidoreductase [Chitinophaga sp.]|uniref:NAD(P)-dependent oxidoreductase n=1 Tax=Chitinophaga sp. TaxID=1869181 RepID=UPI0025C0420E|nr:NAD(P)-dependent oxidoreductase [Chitinophaga sp.]MBV8252162.1 NAD(P)-dependent oxidoreductase [Chitinophaga sp.]
MQKIGFIGLGNLGLPIAANLLKAGHQLKVYNRTREKAKPLEQLGAVLVDSPADAVEKGGIVCTLVSDDAAVREIANEKFLQALGQGGIHVSMSTISPETANDLASGHKEYGVHYVAAPVFARPEAAAAKVGNAVISGDAVAKERIKSLLQDGFAKNVFDVGPKAGSANVLKLIGNFMIGGAMELMAESFVLAEKNGLDVNAAYEMLTTTLFTGPVFRNYGAMILNREFTGNPAFKASLGLKDIDLVLETARKSYTPMPIANLVHQRLLTVLSKGRRDADWVALATGAINDAGLK